MLTRPALMRCFPAILLACASVLPAQEVPRPSPEFVVALPEGTQLAISKLRGKVVALEFMLTTCPHCQQSSKTLTKLAGMYGAKGFQPIGVAVNPNPDINGFKQKFGVTYPVGSGTHEATLMYLQRSIMRPSLMMPHLVFIDRSGVIRAEYGGTHVFFQNEEKNARELIEKLLQETVSSRKGS